MSAAVLSPQARQQLTAQLGRELADAQVHEASLAAFLAPAAGLRDGDARKRLSEQRDMAAQRVQMFASLLHLLQSLADPKPTEAATASA